MSKIPENIHALDANGAPLTLSMLVWIITSIQANGNVTVFNVAKLPNNEVIADLIHVLAQAIYKSEKSVG